MKVVFVGTGYVGLVSGSCFADIGAMVTCVDKDQRKIAALRRGDIPIFEPGLKQLVARNVKAGRLEFGEDLAQAVRGADIVFIAVGTPSRQDGGADLSYVLGAAEEIGAAMDGPLIVVTKSTVPVGTGRKVAAALQSRSPRAPFSIGSAPEFLREGSAIADFMKPDRIVAGSDSSETITALRQLHAPLISRDDQFVATSLETAELIKYAANAFLATKIGFINEIADLCEQTGADVEAVARGMGLDRRIGRWGLSAGPGFGGSCFPKDTRALTFTGREWKSPTRIVETVIDANERRKEILAHKVTVALGGTVKGRTIGVLGLTFKADTDDVRESVSLELIPRLQAAGATIRAYDPEGMEPAKGLLNGVHWSRDVYDALAGADAGVILTEWRHFGPDQLDLARARAVMKMPLLIDLRNLHDPRTVAKAGFRYASIGRPMVAPTT
ncbi:MAG: UDP-glucose/GDP-mannose dehydrogenase family protein [Alphaproteobacteria bacterium]|nr:UDP-glucose/GDP-mannose dehydrogenase family protein [Alphaproteobacteria bacterium]